MHIKKYHYKGLIDLLNILYLSGPQISQRMCLRSNVVLLVHFESNLKQCSIIYQLWILYFPCFSGKCALSATCTAFILLHFSICSTTYLSVLLSHFKIVKSPIVVTINILEGARSLQKYLVIVVCFIFFSQSFLPRIPQTMRLENMSLSCLMTLDLSHLYLLSNLWNIWKRIT